MKTYYELVISHEELAELGSGYAVAYTIAKGEDEISEHALVNFISGNKEVQTLLAAKIQKLLILANNAEKTL